MLDARVQVAVVVDKGQEPLAEAHERMRETGHTVVPVVDEDQRPVGVLQGLE
jgi:CBS domain-containing protein